MRIVVCDDNRVLLEALSHALATRGFIVEAATSRPAEAVAAVKAYDPDLLLVDVSFPDGNGLDVAREVMSDHPRTRVVVLTGSDDAATAIEAARIGVAGFIRKDQRLSAIAEALNRAAAGEPWVDASVTKRLRSPQSNGTTRSPPCGRPHRSGTRRARHARGRSDHDGDRPQRWASATARCAATSRPS